MRFSFALFLLFANPAFSADFTLQPVGNEPLYRTSLEKAVYQLSHTSQIQDISITNAAGEQVPYALVPESLLYPNTVHQTSSVNLPVFTITQANLAQPERLQITLNSSTSSRDLHISVEGKQPETTPLFLIDAGEHHPAYATLQAEWQGGDDQLITVTLSESHDLKTWQPLGNAALLRTSAGSQQILQNKIALNTDFTMRYLQIEPASQQDFKLTSVSAEIAKTEKISSPLSWQNISFLNRETDSKTGQVRLIYEADGRYPTSQLRIQLPQENTITRVSLLVRNQTSQPWVYVGNAALYRTTQHGQAYQNPDITIQPSVARYWQLRFEPSEGGIGTQNPTLSLGWQPQAIVWNARGSAPFTLHVGTNTSAITAVALETLYPNASSQKLQQLPEAKLQMASDSDIKPSAWQEADSHQNWPLWAGLLLGVLVLGMMAYSLIKKTR
jgi:hypothetical protein